MSNELDVPELVLQPGRQMEQLTHMVKDMRITLPEIPGCMFREFSFIQCGGYNSDYWLRCLNDAAIVAGWNEDLDPDAYKRIQYNTRYHDNCDADTWLDFAFMSYLLCQNQFTSFGVANAS